MGVNGPPPTHLKCPICLGAGAMYQHRPASRLRQLWGGKVEKCDNCNGTGQIGIPDAWWHPVSPSPPPPPKLTASQKALHDMRVVMKLSWPEMSDADAAETVLVIYKAEYPINLHVGCVLTVGTHNYRFRSLATCCLQRPSDFWRLISDGTLAPIKDRGSSKSAKPPIVITEYPELPHGRAFYDEP